MFPTYSSALEWLYARNQFAMKLGLENPRRLLAALGNPERAGVFIHVAGTNGKGSVCAALAGMLAATGTRRVGLYTSPHLVSFRERIRVDGMPVPAGYVTDWLNRHIEILEAQNPTYFEIVTAMALCWFRERACEVAVLETGLGGRLDATNVVSPRVTVVTSVALDHTAILGDTLDAILREKLGIVKPGVPLILDEARPALAGLAESTAHDAAAPFLNMADRLSAEASGDLRLRGRFRGYTLPRDLRAESYQVRNAALAVLALEAFRGEALPDESAWVPALRAARVPGRMQRLAPARPGSMPVLLDGAHNPAGLEALRDHLVRNPSGAGARIFFSAMRDKDIGGMHATLSAVSEDLVFVDLSSLYPRALSAEELRAGLTPEHAKRLRVVSPARAALAPLLREGAGADTAVFCGSLYLLGAVIPLLLPDYAGLEEFEGLLREDGARPG